MFIISINYKLISNKMKHITNDFNNSIHYLTLDTHSKRVFFKIGSKIKNFKNRKFRGLDERTYLQYLNTCYKAHNSSKKNRIDLKI